MPRRARQLRGGGNRNCEQRPQDDLRAFGERLLRALLGALRAAAVILDQKLDVGILEFRQRHLGGVLHRLRGDAGIARGRERQDQADLDLAVTDRERLLLRPRGPAIAPNWLKLCCTLEQAPKQRRAENKADRRPPGCHPIWARRLRIRRSRLAIERAYHRISSLDRPRSARTPSAGTPEGGFRHIVGE